jgi:hypothetical protein
MAEIPVERNEKSGLPWWLIPLLLLLLLLPLLWFLSRGCNPAPVANDNGNRSVATTTTNTTNANRGMMNGNANSGAMSGDANSATGANGSTTAGGNANGSTISVDNKGTATGERVTDVNIFGNTADKNSLAGRGVQLTGVKVNRVLSDRVFTVTSGSGEMFAMLSENLDSGGGKEQQIKMRPGQTVNISGDFRRVPDANTKEETQNRDLNKVEYGQMKGQQIYLHTTSVADAK